MQHATRIPFRSAPGTRVTQYVSRHTLWLLILWAAWAVRLWHLDASDLTYDEAATYFVANRPLLDILTYLRAAVREHPPVYYVLMRLWMGVAGGSEYSLRFFAVGASMLGVTLTARLAWALARQLKETVLLKLFVYASLPALILALFPFEVYYARDARMYTLNVVWALLSTLVAWPLLFGRDRGWPRPLRLAALLLVNGLALFTHYYLLLVIVAQFVSLLLLRRWRAWLAWSAAHGAVGLAGIVWLARSPGLSSSLREAWGRFDLAWPGGGQLRRLLADLLFGPIEGVPWALVYGWGLLILLGLLVAWRRSRDVGIWLTVMILGPVALSFLMPEPPRSRYLIFLLPFAALAAGQLLALAGRGRRTTVGAWLGLSALAIVTLGVYGLPRTLRWIKSNYGQTVATVSARARPGDGALFYGPWQWIQFDQYYRPAEFPPITRLPPYAPPPLSPEQAEPVLQELVDTYRRLWVIPAAVDDVDPAHFAEGWLNTHAHPAQITPYYSLYLPPLEGEPFTRAIQLTFGERLRLARLVSDGPTVPAGEGFRLALEWEVLAPLEEDVILVLSLVDGQAHRWRQWEMLPGRWLNPPSQWVAGETVVDRQGLIVPQGAPPGPFTLCLTVVDAVSGAPLALSGAGGPLSQTSVDLLTLDVVEPVAPPALAGVDGFEGPFHFQSPQGTLTLAAYGLGGLRFQQGYPVPLRLHWLAPATPLPELQARLQLRHRSRWLIFPGRATPIVTRTLTLVPGYPLADWSPGRLVSWPLALTLPADAAPGRAELTLSVLGPDGQPWTVDGTDGETRLELGALTVDERPVLKKLPAGLTPVQVDFGDQIGLRGYRVGGQAEPGGQLTLDYAWYALRRPDRQYAVFNHLLTADGQFIIQVDGWPQNPRYGPNAAVVLTKMWQPGEYIPDRHVLEIPADAPPGPYLLAVGLYDAGTVERLPAVQDGRPLPNDQWLHPLDGP